MAFCSFLIVFHTILKRQGETYSGEQRYLIEERDDLFAEEEARLTGEGIFGSGECAAGAASGGYRRTAGRIQGQAVENEDSTGKGYAGGTLALRAETGCLPGRKAGGAGKRRNGGLLWERRY